MTEDGRLAHAAGAGLNNWMPTIYNQEVLQSTERHGCGARLVVYNSFVNSFVFGRFSDHLSLSSGAS